ncbi:cytochrome-c peroxidase [Brevundimonas sp. GCM10030266]|uniref:cytochrome-c peroxidase n=1 Tax=Brevundimonas sp. GCM10030266 TaxID=3273386 RepID=UPI00361A7A82
MRHVFRHAFPTALTLAICAIAGAWAFDGVRAEDGDAPVRVILSENPTTEELRTAYAGAPETWPAPLLRAGAVFNELGALPPAPAPADNPTTREKAALGQRLFDDPRLSASGQIACASCHAQEMAFADGLRTSFGHDRQRGRRNSPSVAASAWMPILFWDGRADTLEAQSLHPIVDPLEMAGALPEIEARIAADPAYAEDFRKAFGDEAVTIDRIAKALAAFQRNLRPGQGRWRRFIGGERRALSDQQLRGLHLFRTKASCASCHSGPVFSDGRFHNLGLTFYGREREDLGRYEVTGQAADVGAFRTPSLLSVSRTGPWMHNGLFPIMEGIVRFYNAGGAHPRPQAGQENDPLFPKTDPMLEPLDLTNEEIDDLVAFLETL